MILLRRHFQPTQDGIEILPECKEVEWRDCCSLNTVTFSVIYYSRHACTGKCNLFVFNNKNSNDLIKIWSTSSAWSVRESICLFVFSHRPPRSFVARSVRKPQELRKTLSGTPLISLYYKVVKLHGLWYFHTAYLSNNPPRSKSFLLFVCFSFKCFFFFFQL